MLFDFEHNVQIARRSAVGPRFAFTGNAKSRSGIHTRRNTQLNGFLALEASLPAAFLATLLHDLPRALTRWARARDGEKSLLIGKLATASASLAGLNASAFFRPGAVAGFAEFLARQLDLSGYARGSFLERKRHVISQVGATLRAAAATPASAPSKQICEAKEISEDVVEILEDSIIKSLTGSAGKPGMTVRVVNLPLLRIAEHAVGFRAFAKLYFRLGFVFRIAVRMPLERRFAIRAFDFVDGGGPCHAENFVIIPLIPLGPGNVRSPLIHCFFRCRIWMHGYTHHRGAQHAPMKHIAGLKHLQYGAVCMVRRFCAVHCLMQMRIKRFSNRINPLRTQLRHAFQKLFVDELKALAVIVVFGFAVRRESVLKPVNHRNEPFNHASRGALGIFKTLFFDPLAVIVKVGLPPQQSLAQFFEVSAKLGDLCVGLYGIRSNRLCFRGLLGFCVVIVLIDVEIDFHFLVAHFLTSPVPKSFQGLLSASLKSCAT